MKWDKQDVSPLLVKNISAKYSCDLLTASILARRGILQGKDILYYLEDDPRHLRNPFEMSGMEDAVDRILAAKEEGEKILVFGDRDVDGISSSAMLTEFLRSIGLDVNVRLPYKDEPYGLTIPVINEFASEYGTLIITVDCGISNMEEVKHASSLGIDVIITDHHNPQEEVPEAHAIINPKLGSSYPFRDLAGCGVVYKLVSALRFALKSELYCQPLCLLNTRPLNDSWVVEIAKLRNLVLVDTLTETIIPGVLSIGDTRLPAFLEGQQILVWDLNLQKQTMAKIFGRNVEIYMQDISAEIGKEIPSAAGKSLIRLKEISKTAKYSDEESSELDVLVNLFITFIRQREKLFTQEDAQDLQLACLGTIADIMPLRDENRIIVRQGLKSLLEKPRSGLLELMFKLELMGRRSGTTEISWVLCPAINATGRMGSPEKALNLLMEKEQHKREALVSEIIALNEERKKLGEDIWEFVEPLATESLKNYKEKFALAGGKNIPRGVTGIMASRLTSRLKVPSLVASIGDEVITASLRSTRAYDLNNLLEPKSNLFLDWGGHNYAAGFSMHPSNWDIFLDYIKEISGEITLSEAKDEDFLTIDAELPLSFLNPDIYNLIDLFEPYGEANDTLTFLSRKLLISELSLIGKPEAKHVKLTLDAGKHKWPAVYWQAAEKVKREFDLGDMVDIVYKVTRNWYKGSETPQLVIHDLKRSDA